MTPRNTRLSTKVCIRRLRTLLFACACLLFSFGGALPASAQPQETAVFAGGCFWGVEAVFRHVRGVTQAVSGYSGGRADTAHYDQVSGGDTGHAESVLVRFNPAQVSFDQLLQVFFLVAHDPTQRDRQGPDVGSQYRSVIFYAAADQQEIAQRTIRQFTQARTFPDRIVTQVVPLQQFHPAEAYHQNYVALHPREPYVVFNDLPKLLELRRQFPDMFR